MERKRGMTALYLVAITALLAGGAARADDLVESVNVTVRRYDERGKQVGSPRDVILRRYKGGRWYVREGLGL